MEISFDSIKHVVSAYGAARTDAGKRVRVAVYVDASATPFLIDAVRGALVPETTAAVVRVSRLAGAAAPAEDTDVCIVLTCGGEGLEAAVSGLVLAGAPVVVVAESSVEVPFIERDSRLLGLVAATDRTHLLNALARWILDRTDKDAAFAANFPFMRVSAAGRAVTACALGNAATALIVWPRGADFPTMTLAQLDMMLKLAGIYGKPIGPERAYEAAGVVACACAMRSAARLLTRHLGRYGIVAKALIGGAGSYAVGLGLCALYRRDVSYERVNEAVAAAVARAREAAGAVAERRAAGSRGDALAVVDAPQEGPVARARA